MADINNPLGSMKENDSQSSATNSKETKQSNFIYDNRAEIEYLRSIDATLKN